MLSSITLQLGSPESFAPEMLVSSGCPVGAELSSVVAVTLAAPV